MSRTIEQVSAMFHFIKKKKKVKRLYKDWLDDDWKIVSQILSPLDFQTFSQILLCAV